MKKTCFTCRIDKALCEFGNNRSKHDGKQPYCLVCSRDKDKKHYAGSEKRRRNIRRQNKRGSQQVYAFLIDYLRQHPCVDCNETDILVLQFDHDRGRKAHNITGMLHRSLQNVRKELAKCDVRCANCHARKTATRRLSRRVKFLAKHGIQKPGVIHDRH